MIKINEDTFDKYVLESKVPVLVSFGAEWCTYCKMLEPVLNELYNESFSLIVGKVDTDTNKKLSRKYRISSLPTTILVYNGEVVKSWTGVHGKEEFKREIENLGT